MSTQPIDYDALAAQHGGTVDYDALAAQGGGTSPAAQQPSLAAQAHAEMSAKPTGAKQWLTDLESDLRYGGQQTVVGRALKAAGYQHAESLGGMEGTAGKTLVSPLTGPVFAAHGVAEALSGHPMRGAGEVLSGIGEAATIPMSFAAPETGEAAASGASKATKAISSLTPNAMREAAGELFQSVKAKAGDFPVNVETPGAAALRIKELADRGGSMPMVIRKFLNRVTTPDGSAMTYSEARDFYSNASRLSADETNRLTPRLKFEVGNFTRQLGKSIQSAASDAGVGAEHTKAMSDYARAMNYADRVEAAKTLLIKGATKASGAAATAYGAKKVWDASK